MKHPLLKGEIKPVDTATRMMLVSHRQFGFFAFGNEGMKQISETKQRLASSDLFDGIPVLTINMIRIEMGWPSGLSFL